MLINIRRFQKAFDNTTVKAAVVESEPTKDQTVSILLSSDNLWISLKKLQHLFNRREKIGFGFLLLGMMGSALLETLSIGTIPIFLNLVISPGKVMRHEIFGPVMSSFGITNSRSLIIWGSVVLIAIFLVKAFYEFIFTYLEIRYLQDRQLRLVDQLFTTYMNAPYEFHLNRNTSELLRNIQEEVARIIHHVLTPILSVVMQGLMTLMLVGLLITAESRVSLAVVALFVLAGGGYELLLRKRLRSYGKREQVYRKHILQTLQQGLGSLKEIRILQREEYFTQDLRQNVKSIMLTNRFSKLASRMTTPYMEFLATAGLLGSGLAMMMLGRDLQSVTTTLVLFAVVFVRLKSGVSSIVSAFTSIHFNIASVNPIYDDLRFSKMNSGISITGKLSLEVIPVRMEEYLNLKSVSYHYPGTTDNVLQDVTMNISKGEAVALIGPTGSGKTTLVDVILGLLKPQDGQVMVDGRSIHDNLAAWQRTIGYIPQFIYLLDDTIRNNVALGLENNHIDDIQVWQAVRAAQMEEYIKTLPDGLDTVVGERGVRLSGGQRQRIGIARALYHNPDILILDEATSALDNTTEKDVMRAVNSLKGERTLIMIAHRLTTVRHCDRLYFMKEGRIESVGTYDQLIETNCEFRMMTQK